MALIKEYFELTKRYQDEYGERTILLMQVGSFFEVYGIYDEDNLISGSKILEFSQICELNVVDKNTCVGKNNVMMAGFKDIMIEKYLRKIQDAGYTAVVYAQDENVKNTTRSCAGIFSPGTYFHPESPNLTNSITCIWIDFIDNKILLKGKHVVVGIANIDIFTGKSNIYQFKEPYIDNPSTYDELERFISIHNPNEVILISNLPDESEMDSVISYAGVTSSLIHKIHISNDSKHQNTSQKIIRVKNCEKQPYQKEILSKFYKFDNYEVFAQNFYDNNIATQAFCFLLDFVYQHNPHLVNRIYEPTFENCSTRLSLANHTLKQLNIIDDGNVKPSKYSCVSQLLNDCLTPMGKRKFLYNFLNPTFDENYLQREYDITEYFLSNFNNYDSFLKTNLSTIKDLSKFERQVFLKKTTPKMFYNLYNNLQTVQIIFEKVTQDNTLREYFNIFESNFERIYEYCDIINKFICSNLDLSLISDLEQLQNFEINFIKPGIYEELDKKTQNLKDSELKMTAIQDYFNSLVESREKKNSKTSEFVKIHETEKNNYSLLLTNRRCKILQELLPSLDTVVTLNYDQLNNKNFDFKVSKSKFHFEKQTSTNNCIIDEQISGICRSISSIKISMKDLITSVFNKFVNIFEQYQCHLESIINFVTLVDLLYTKAAIAKKYKYCKPNIVTKDKSFVDAKQLRHCLIERFQMNELYVTNDIVLGDGVVDGILLYGTNAVGKTSFIRALGVSVIMAQSGLYVPCTEFNYKPYKSIFTRIIGNDNIFKGLSTFAVEMSELRTILRLMDQDSFILGDELCSGTETLSAISIFVAGIRQLHKSRSSFIFATHLHEIVNYEEIISLNSVHLKHMEVKYDKQRDLLIYDRKLKDGPGNNMYGLEVCKSLSLPQEFLDDAYEIRMKYHPEGQSILSLKQSRYNSNKIVGTCEKCGKNMGSEVHHLQYQSNSDINGYIVNDDSVFHKNNLANLMTLCESCHDEIHKTNTKQKKVKTNKGDKLLKI